MYEFIRFERGPDSEMHKFQDAASSWQVSIHQDLSGGNLDIRRLQYQEEISVPGGNFGTAYPYN